MSDIHFLTETKRTVIGQAHISPIQETAKPTSPPPHVWVFQRPFHYEISFFCPTFTKKTIRAKTTIYSHPFKIHPWKRTCPLKRDYFSREYIFQPLIFRGHVSFQGSMPIFASHGLRPTRQKKRKLTSHAGNQQIDQMHALGPLQSCSRLQRLHEVGSRHGYVGIPTRHRFHDQYREWLGYIYIFLSTNI